MRKISLLLALVFLIGLVGCSSPQPTPEVMATTKPVYDFTSALCRGTNISVGLLISESVSCLHDYSLNVSQVRKAEASEVMVISGAGLEDFMDDLLDDCDTVIDSSAGIALLECAEEHDHDHDHHHEADAHIWLAPKNAKLMAKNICDGLCKAYPQQRAVFQENLAKLNSELDALQAYGEESLSSLSCRELVTFHDGFGYLAHAFDLTIAAAVEEESGSEASAKELIELIELVQQHHIPAIFAETNGSISAPGIISAETGVSVHMLDMGMGSGDYFKIMRHNIDTLKEALG